MMTKFNMIMALLLVPLAVASAQEINRKELERIDQVVEQTIAAKGCPGAVVVVLLKDQVVYEKAFGLRAVAPEEEPMTLDTIFDLASLTKPVATATAIWQLIEANKLALNDPIAKHWPEFAANGKAEVTIEHCLKHTSGLIADNALADYANGKAVAFDKIAQLKLLSPPGSQFRYSDVGFLALGKVVEQVSGKSLEEYTAEAIFRKLGMKDTYFRVPAEKLARVAPTGRRQGQAIRGEVHDPRAFALGGVAGHAGLFSTAADLTRYCQALLNDGQLGNAVLLQPDTVKNFTKPADVAPKGQRSAGWDVATGYTAQRGQVFRPGTGYGHTGFTGTSLWLDPETKTAIIILTSRVHPNDQGNVTPLRREVGTIVAEALRVGQVLPGIDVLRQQQFERLKGKRIGLVTNHTGVAIDGTPTIDLLHQANGVKLVALFSPEHGIRGALDEKVSDGRDETTGLPIYSLYGERRKPTAEQLQGLDLIVYDIQDIGCRFYTYISTLGLVMEAAKEAKLPVLVLDRPNPLGGAIEGPMRDPSKPNAGPDFVAFHELPLRHGMTVGELAKMFNQERGYGIALEVVTVQGWNHKLTFEQTGLPWRNPSPNIRHLTAAFLYPGVGLLETTNLSVGRGTERPFEWIGAPYINGVQLAAALNRLRLPGIAFVPVDRTPTSSVFKNQLCHGVDLIVLDRAQLEAVPLGIHLAATLRKLYPVWETKNLNRLLVHQSTFEGIVAAEASEQLIQAWGVQQEEFRKRRERFLLYPD